MNTLYELLGVCPDATDEALKKAYRGLAKMHHPDLNPNDPDAARRFRQISGAIAILCDAKRRAAYNQRLVRELQRRLDREREHRRMHRARVATSAVAAALIGIVAMNESSLVGSISSTSVPTAGMTYDVVQQPVGVLTAQRESVSREKPSDKLQPLPAVVPPPRTTADDRSEVSARPGQHCRHGAGPHCEPLEGRAADERELSANERRALIRQAEELLASGDAKGSHLLSQRACRSSGSRCGPGLREDL